MSGVISFDLWAWVELNYRPHAYQATEGEYEVRQEIVKSLTDSVICRCSPFGMSDNVGGNRQLNRQQMVSAMLSAAILPDSVGDSRRTSLNVLSVTLRRSRLPTPR